MKAVEPILTTKDLRVGFHTRGKEVILFENLNVSLFPGSLICFMGKNGSGKSSLLRTIAGLQRELGGTVSFSGPQRRLPEILSVVLTDRVTGTNLSVRELVSYGRYPYVGWTGALNKNDEAIIDSALDILGIEHLRDSRVNELSDGQMQMVMIARALAQETPVILLDEPTAHLDLNNRVEIMKLLRKLTRRSGKSILVTTHELDLALQTSDLIWLAGSGKSITSGVPEDLILNGTFDRIFELKGFDLKTGRILHSDTHSKKIFSVTGEGAEFLWTRNALERSGFTVTARESNAEAIDILVDVEEGRPRWRWLLNNRPYEAGTIAEMIELLSSIDCEIPE
jgi:iron complex transport system ATP-binding protein